MSSVDLCSSFDVLEFGLLGYTAFVRLGGALGLIRSVAQSYRGFMVGVSDSVSGESACHAARVCAKIKMPRHERETCETERIYNTNHRL